jgi:hypothetical protein
MSEAAEKEREAAAPARQSVVSPSDSGEKREPVAYAFDGWTFVPLEISCA